MWESTFRELAQLHDFRGIEPILNTLERLNVVPNPVIVEVGVMNRKQQTCATFAFAGYCAEHGGSYIGVDKDVNAIAFSRTKLEPFIQYVTLRHDDALRFLPTLTRPIDLIFMDAWHETIENGARNHLLAFQSLNVPVNYVLIDNIYEGRIHKGTELCPYLLAHGYRQVFSFNEMALYHGKQTDESPEGIR